MNTENSGMHRLQTVNLEMIKLFTEICRKYDLTYFALGGTLLEQYVIRDLFPGMMMWIWECPGRIMKDSGKSQKKN